MAETKHIASPTASSPKKDKPRGKSRKWWTRWWAWVLWIFCALIILLLIAAAYIWTNRYALIEDMAIDALAQDGIEAQLNIESLSKTHAAITGIKLSSGGQDVFSVKRIEADFEWRDALEGQIKSALLIEPRARITLDENGKIIDNWLPQSESSETEKSDSTFPENGVTLKDAILSIQSPYGQGQISGDIDVKTPQDFTAKLSLEPTQLSYKTLNLSGGGRIDMTRAQDKLSLDSHLTLSTLSGPDLEAKDITLSLNGRPEIKAQRFDGQAVITLSSLNSSAIDTKDLSLTLDGQTDLKTKRFSGQALAQTGGLETAQLFLGQSDIDWNGEIIRTDSFFDLNGNWAATLNAARIPDPARRDELAATLSFHAPLSKSPIAQHFIPEIRSALTSLLAGSAVKARGDLQRNDDVFKLTLTAPANIKSSKTALTITPHKTAPAYNFDRAAQRITAALDASFTQPSGLSLMGISFEARSFNGFRLDGVEDFSAKVTTNAPWTGLGVDGRPVRLSPLDLYMGYDGSNLKRRKVTLSGGVDYDGALPGVYVEGLKAAGDMDLILNDKDQMQIGYAPKGTAHLRIDKAETTTDWTAYDFDADITAGPSLFTRDGATGKSFADLNLTNLKTQIRRKSEPASLDVTAATLNANALLAASSQDTLTQNWDVAFTQALVTSDDLPGPDTVVTIPEGALKAELITGAPLEFDLTTPSANVMTQLVKVDNMALRLHGQPTNFDIEHSGGKVKLAGNTLPPIPIEGSLNSAGGALIGQAKARLPQADNTPITMTYNIRDGAGYADVDIEALHFTPDGLQPQNLIKALRGKVAQVDGMASAKVRLEFARDKPMKSSGTAKIINMNLGTAPGPLTGMNMELSMDSVLPLVSRGRQRITVASFDPGIPLKDGVIDFELIDDGVKIYDAKWPLGDGFFSLDPFVWSYGTDENRLTMRLSDVELGQFLESMGNDSIQATGKLQGTFPIVISGVNLRVEKGEIGVKDGGVIRFRPAEADGSPPESFTQDEALNILRTKDQARYGSLARDVLREFNYQELSVKVDGALDGEVELGTVFTGSNSKVLNGQPFEFDINVIGELFNIIRSFDSNEHILSQLEKQGISTEGLAVGDE